MNPTKEMIKWLFLSIAISVAALIAGASSVTAAVTTCDGTLPGGTYDTVIVPKGKICIVGDGLGPVTVEQNVILQEGASINGVAGVFTVNGNLQGDGVRNVDITGLPGVPTTIHGNVSITGATGAVVVVFVNIGGNLNISDSNGLGIFVEESQVNGNALFQNNTTSRSFFIAGNTIVGNLVCNGNNPAPTVDTTTVGGQRMGQCAQ
jgi:hypothetical protein